jgi:hypothetical protein
LHDHYLFNRSYNYDAQDYSGLPWMFYYANVGSSPPPATLRTRCPMQQVNGTPYEHANFGWFRYPAPGENWQPSDGTEPLAATGEYLETAQFGPMGSASLGGASLGGASLGGASLGAANPAGFVFNGEFAGEANPPSLHTPGQPPHYFVETAYFTNRECSDAGTEYGWFRTVADTDFGDEPVNSFTFYYSKFTNCNQDYACWDIDGHQVEALVATVNVSDVAPNAAGTYQYKFQVIRSGSNFNLSILDPGSGSPVSCQWSMPAGGGSGPCQFSAPIASWYPAPDQMASGYIVVATQSSHLYPAMTGAPYPEWYDYGGAGLGAAPPKNVVPTLEPNGTQSCLTRGAGYACLNALSLQVLYE